MGCLTLSDPSGAALCRRAGCHRCLPSDRVVGCGGPCAGLIWEL